MCNFLHAPLQLSGTLLATPLDRRTQLNYVIVRRPLDLWNRMFNRHQAEITVMQFTGHSLSVRQSMRVSCDFFILSHFISQFPPTRFPLITAIRKCHPLPMHHFEWHFGRVKRSKHNTDWTWEHRQLRDKSYNPYIDSTIMKFKITRTL